MMGVTSHGSAPGKGEVIMGRCFPLDGPGATYKTSTLPVVRGVVYKDNKIPKASSGTTFGIVKKDFQSPMASANASLESNNGGQGPRLIVNTNNHNVVKDFSSSNSSTSIAHEVDVKGIRNQADPAGIADSNTAKDRLSRASKRTVSNAGTEVQSFPRERSRLRFKEDSIPKREISAERVLVPPTVKQKVMIQNAGEKSSIRIMAAPRSHSYDEANARWQGENRRSVSTAPHPTQKPSPYQRSCINPTNVCVAERVADRPEGPSEQEPRNFQQETKQARQSPKQGIQCIPNNDQEYCNVQCVPKKEHPVLKTILKDPRKSQLEQEKGSRQLTGKEAWEATQRKKALLREEFFRVPYEECNREALRGLGGRLNKSEPRMHLVGRERKKRNSFSCKRRVHFELDYINDEKQRADDESKSCSSDIPGKQANQPQSAKSRSGRPTDLDELMRTMSRTKGISEKTKQNLASCSIADQVQNSCENKARVSKSLVGSKFDSNHNIMKYDGHQHPLKKNTEASKGLTSTSSNILVPTSYQILKSCTALPSTPAPAAAPTCQSTTCSPDDSHFVLGLSTQSQISNNSHASSHSVKPSQTISCPPSVCHSNTVATPSSRSSNSSPLVKLQSSDLSPTSSPKHNLLSSPPTPTRHSAVTPTEQPTFSVSNQSSNSCVSTGFPRPTSGPSRHQQSEDQRTLNNQQKSFTENSDQHYSSSSKPSPRERFYDVDHKRTRSQTRVPDVQTESKSYHHIPHNRPSTTDRTSKIPFRSRSSSFDKSYLSKRSQNMSKEPHRNLGDNKVVYPEKSNKENVEASYTKSKKSSIDDRGDLVNILMTKGESYSKHNIVLNSHVTSSTPKVTVKRIYVPISSTPVRSPPSPTPSCASSSCSFGSSGSSSGCFSGSPSPTPTPSPTRARASCVPTDL